MKISLSILLLICSIYAHAQYPGDFKDYETGKYGFKANDSLYLPPIYDYVWNLRFDGQKFYGVKKGCEVTVAIYDKRKKTFTLGEFSRVKGLFKWATRDGHDKWVFGYDELGNYYYFANYKWNLAKEADEAYTFMAVNCEGKYGLFNDGKALTAFEYDFMEYTDFLNFWVAKKDSTLYFLDDQGAIIEEAPIENVNKLDGPVPAYTIQKKRKTQNYKC